MCKICGNDTVKKTICNQEYDFCPICGFLAKDDKCIPDSKSEYERYLKHNNDDNDGYYKYQHKFYLEIKDFLGELNLDFGCGEGKILSKILNENSLNTVGYDLYFHHDVNYKKHLYSAIILEEVIERNIK